MKTILDSLALFAARPVGAAEFAAPDKAFVSDYCTSCHNDMDKKGGLDLTNLAFDPNDSASRQSDSIAGRRHR